MRYIDQNSSAIGSHNFLYGCWLFANVHIFFRDSVTTSILVFREISGTPNGNHPIISSGKRPIWPKSDINIKKTCVKASGVSLSARHIYIDVFFGGNGVFFIARLFPTHSSTISRNISDSVLRLSRVIY